MKKAVLRTVGVMLVIGGLVGPFLSSWLCGINFFMCLLGGYLVGLADRKG